jgi:hypothetical protein
MDEQCYLIIGKVSFVRNVPAVVEPLFATPFPGDPLSADYENGLPDMPAPYVAAIGNVLSASNKPYKSFVLATSEYLSGNTVTYTLQ